MKKHSFFEYYTRIPRSLGVALIEAAGFWYCSSCKKHHGPRVISYRIKWPLNYKVCSLHAEEGKQ